MFQKIRTVVVEKTAFNDDLKTIFSTDFLLEIYLEFHTFTTAPF
jgi:hypothetical protein